MDICICKRCGNPFSAPHKWSVYCGDACRFWANVSITTSSSECWEWNGTAVNSGYGRFRNTHGLPSLAHRAAYTLVIGEVPDGMFILHLCHNKKCVNPAHLMAGDHAENMRQMIEAGRQNWPARAPMPLTDERIAASAEKFWAKVERKGENECWGWSGPKTPKGRGVAKVLGHSSTSAPRLAWILTNGPISDPALFVCHSCDDPACCNPLHMFLGTNSEDRPDMYEKRRTIGRSPGQKLTAEQAAAIKRDNRPLSVIAKEYGLVKQTIANIRNGVTWKHLR